jgi:hypothetical protein
LLDFDGANYFTLTGAQADQLEITAGAETAAEATIKFMANPYTSYTSAPTPFTTLTLGTEHMIPAWDTVVTVGGTTLTYISELTLTLARKTAPIFTMGNQAPHVVFAGPLEVSGKFTAVLNSNADIWSTGTSAEALTYSPEAVTITLTDPNDITSGTNNSIEFTMSAVQFQNVKRTRGKEYVEVEVEFTASANTTDAVTGYAPISATIVNAIATAYN